MRTFVITGGTDGMGRGLGLHYLERGDRVIAVGSSEAKGALFLAAAADLGAAGRPYPLRAVRPGPRRHRHRGFERSPR